MTPRLSRPLVVVASVGLIAGLLSGLAFYLGRSSEVEAHVDGTDAWIPHLVLAAVAAVWFALAVRRGPRVLLAPLGHPIAERIAATFRSVAGPTGVLRCLVASFLLVLEVYACWRFGVQVLGGLDPNFTANAWGGPSYVGAMFCHYLDGALLLAIFHTALRAVTVPARRTALT